MLHLANTTGTPLTLSGRIFVMDISRTRSCSLELCLHPSRCVGYLHSGEGDIMSKGDHDLLLNSAHYKLTAITDPLRDRLKRAKNNVMDVFLFENPCLVSMEVLKGDARARIDDSDQRVLSVLKRAMDIAVDAADNRLFIDVDVTQGHTTISVSRILLTMIAEADGEGLLATASESKREQISWTLARAMVRNALRTGTVTLDDLYSGWTVRLRCWLSDSGGMVRRKVEAKKWRTVIGKEHRLTWKARADIVDPGDALRAGPFRLVRSNLEQSGLPRPLACAVLDYLDNAVSLFAACVRQRIARRSVCSITVYDGSVWIGEFGNYVETADGWAIMVDGEDLPWSLEDMAIAIANIIGEIISKEFESRDVNGTIALGSRGVTAAIIPEFIEQVRLRAGRGWLFPRQK